MNRARPGRVAPSPSTAAGGQRGWSHPSSGFLANPCGNNDCEGFNQLTHISDGANPSAKHCANNQPSVIAPEPAGRSGRDRPALKIRSGLPHPAYSFGLGLKSAKRARLPLAARWAALRSGSAPAVAPPALHFLRPPPANRSRIRMKCFRLNHRYQYILPNA